MKSIFNRIAHIGCDEQYSELDNRYIVLTNSLNFIMMCAMLYWVILALLFPPALNYNLIIFIINIACCLFTFYLNYIRKNLTARVFILIVYCCVMIAHIVIIGTVYGHHLLFMPAMLVTFFLFSRKQLQYSIFICALSLLAFLFFEFNTILHPLVIIEGKLDRIIKSSSNLTLFFATLLLIIYIAFIVFEAESKLNSEKAKSEGLLLNILPGSIANRLKTNSGNIADHFASVSILFADIVGFTKFSTGKTPEVIVTVLNDIFSKFDDLAEKYKLEKIKTIGDCYMVAAGIPLEQKDHAVKITNFALDMVTVINNLQLKAEHGINMRIGINSGAVVAGVIGKKKFIYDMWGDAVNIASRMESHGISGEIQITRSTYDLIKDYFLIEERGEIEVKGKGNMKTYLVRSRI